MKTCLVTGVAGFIGSHVAKDCLKQGYKVIGVDDLSGGVPTNVPDGVEFIEGSCGDADLLDRIFTGRKIHYIYHLAAYAAEGLSHFVRVFNYKNNLLSSVALINRAVNHDVECFIFTSSIAVYGKNQLPMSEEMVPLPEDPYGIGKYAVELDLKCAHEMFGLNYVIFRPHNVYGENQNIADKYRNVIGIFMNQILQGMPMSIFGDGKQTRAFTYVRDISPIIARAPQMPETFNQVFNIGADRVCSVYDLAGLVAQAMEVEAKINLLPARNEILDAYASHEKCRRIFGMNEQTALLDGLIHMAKWVKSSGPRSTVRFNDIEIRKNLPASWQ
ncbi:MAG: NAD-dependent epimerase/dehydratase family protein [Verrucomicrobiota bacterium]|nr:NAD-dependent epimerase/dehydratase family protein [Verrucomicrobiota bacterium]